MFERFTDRARLVIVLAQEEARRLNHDYIGTEHLLLGLVREDEGVAARALAALDVSLEDVRRQVEEIVGRGGNAPPGAVPVPFTPRAKKVLELSLREAIGLEQREIGTEHILLGLIREGEGVAAQVLRRSGASLDAARSAIETLSGRAPETTPTSRVEAAEEAEPASGASPTCPSCGASLTRSGVVSRITVRHDNGEPVQVRVLFCRSCGTAIGTVA